MIFAPRPYQQEASDFLVSHNEAALFTGMGLGKTATVLHALSRLMLDGECSGALIVAPLRVCNLTWPAEVKDWEESFGWMRVANLRSEHGQKLLKARSAHLYLCNYEMLPKISKIKNPPWDTVVFDELTRAKNHTSSRINEYRKEAAKLRRRWGLTGTPTPNSYLEIFAQIRLLDGGKRLGPSFHSFRNAWFAPTDYMEYNWEPKPGAVDGITKRFSDIVLTQRSSDYADVADYVAQDIEVAMPEEAKEQYAELEKELLVLLGDADTPVVAQTAGVLANKLLQVTGGAVYDEVRTVHTVHDAKIEALKKLCKKLAPHPVLIACNYRHEQDRIVEALPGCVRFDSAKTIAQQEDLVARWNRKEIRYLVSDPRSIGHGLNLQKGGSNVVWFSPTYSRELFDQFNCRLHRSGQKETVTVWRIIAKDTIDEAVVETLRRRDVDQKALLALLHNLQRLREI